MKKILFILMLLYSISNYAQFGLGKDINIAKKEIKEILKKNNFHFIKETKGLIEDSFPEVVVVYKEGFYVNITYDQYKKCTLIQVMIDSANKQKLYKQLLNAFDFSKWTYLPDSKNLKNKSQSIKFFKYKKMFIQTEEYREHVAEGETRYSILLRNN